MAGLKVENLHAGYVPDIDILRGLDLEARPRQLTTVIGANGVGKSTLFKCIVGQLRPHAGTITYDGRDLLRLRTEELARNRIAYIPQRRNVFPHLTVTENLEMGAWTFRRDRRRVAEAIRRAFERAPVLAEFRDRPAGDMSGGQQRLLEIERALLIDPALLLIDEPTVGLDPRNSAAIYRYLRDLVDDQGRTILMVDQNVIAGTDVADYIYVLELGTNKLEGTKAEFDSTYRDTVAEWLF